MITVTKKRRKTPSYVSAGMDPPLPLHMEGVEHIRAVMKAVQLSMADGGHAYIIRGNSSVMQVSAKDIT